MKRPVWLPYWNFEFPDIYFDTYSRGKVRLNLGAAHGFLVGSVQSKYNAWWVVGHREVVHYMKDRVCS